MRILFFDTETSGLPKNYNASVEQIENWPRLVQIAWQVYDLKGKLLEEEEFVIKPNGFEIPIEASKVHKITTQKAQEIGVDLSKILNIFSNVIKKSDLLVAHNYSFDYSIIGAELLRNGLENTLKNKEHICTMKSSTDFCKISGPYGNKWPKLEELYDILFNETFNAHNALDDIKATSRCFWELQKKSIIKIINTKEIESNKTSKAPIKSEITFSHVAPLLEKKEQECNNKINVVKLHKIDTEKWNIQFETSKIKIYFYNNHFQLESVIEKILSGSLSFIVENQKEEWDYEYIYNPNYSSNEDAGGQIQEIMKFTGTLVLISESVLKEKFIENEFNYFEGSLINYKGFRFGKKIADIKFYEERVWHNWELDEDHENGWEDGNRDK